MPVLQHFAIGGDRSHGPGRRNPSTDPWWSALALGADGLACILEPGGGDVVCQTSPGVPISHPIPLDDFLLAFGQACPLSFLIPNETALESNQISTLIDRLLSAALRFPPHIVAPAAALANIAQPEDALLFALNDYAEPMLASGQAWRADTAVSHFPDLRFPEGDHGNARLLVRRGRSGELAPLAWLLADFGSEAARNCTTCLLHDDFAASTRSPHWVFGYSNPLPESFIHFGTTSDPGFVIDLPQGYGYSGGGGVLRMPLVTAFDARVQFQAESIGPGLAFELAGITIDPPRGTLIDHHDTSEDKYRSLVFDVHGAPPYVSSECDEGDGFRISWNMASNATYFIDQQPASMNMYNRYGDDVDDAQRSPPIAGELRLVRQGDFWASYVRSTTDAPWRCTGTLHFPGLPPRIYLRLGAKHWPKLADVGASANRVRFTQFSVYVPTWRQA